MTCPNSVVASGITLIVGIPQNLFVRDASAGCAPISPGGGATCVVAPSSLVAVAAGSNGFTLTPSAPGTGTATFSAPGFVPVPVSLTVIAGILDVTT